MKIFLLLIALALTVSTQSPSYQEKFEIMRAREINEFREALNPLDIDIIQADLFKQLISRSTTQSTWNEWEHLESPWNEGQQIREALRRLDEGHRDPNLIWWLEDAVYHAQKQLKNSLELSKKGEVKAGPDSDLSAIYGNLKGLERGYLAFVQDHGLELFFHPTGYL